MRERIAYGSALTGGIVAVALAELHHPWAAGAIAAAWFLAYLVAP